MTPRAWRGFSTPSGRTGNWRGAGAAFHNAAVMQSVRVGAGHDPRPRRCPPGARQAHAKWRNTDAQHRWTRSRARSQIGTTTVDDSSGELRRPENPILDTFGGKVGALGDRSCSGSDTPSVSARPDSDHDTWGVSDPAWRPPSRVCEARAGSLTPHLDFDTCAGALTGRHNTPPVLTALSDSNIGSFKGLRRLGDPNPPDAVGEPGTSAPAQRGPTAPWPCVPLLGPST